MIGRNPEHGAGSENTKDGKLVALARFLGCLIETFQVCHGIKCLKEPRKIICTGWLHLIFFEHLANCGTILEKCREDTSGNQNIEKCNKDIKTCTSRRSGIKIVQN